MGDSRGLHHCWELATSVSELLSGILFSLCFSEVRHGMHGFLLQAWANKMLLWTFHTVDDTLTSNMWPTLPPIFYPYPWYFRYCIWNPSAKPHLQRVQWISGDLLSQFLCKFHWFNRLTLLLTCYWIAVHIYSPCLPDFQLNFIMFSVTLECSRTVFLWTVLYCWLTLWTPPIVAQKAVFLRSAWHT